MQIGLDSLSSLFILMATESACAVFIHLECIDVLFFGGIYRL